MGKYVIRRVLQAALTLVGASVVLFFVLFVITDPFATFGERERDPVTKAELEHRYGLDRPIPVQYGKWVSGVVRGDFGKSLRGNRTVNEIIGQKLPNTFKLALTAFLIEILVGLVAGLISAVLRYSFWDVFVTLTTTLAIGFPTFVLGLMFQYTFGIRWRFLPLTGTSPEGWFGLDRHVVMPACTLAFIDAAVLARLMRGQTLEMLRADFVRTARAKGLRDRTVLIKHVARNAIIPVVTYMGVILGTLLGGAVITENIFNWDGLGKALVNAIYDENNPVVIGIVTYGVLVFVILNLVVDLLYGWLDPRIRLE
jgi:oligopeptide transport system permease protein